MGGWYGVGAHSQVEVISLWFLSNFLVILRSAVSLIRMKRCDERLSE